MSSFEYGQTHRPEQTSHFHTVLDLPCSGTLRTDIAGTQARSQRRAWAWCWAIPTPSRTVTAEVYEEVFIDGIYLPYDWCLLIARKSGPCYCVAMGTPGKQHRLSSLVTGRGTTRSSSHRWRSRRRQSPRPDLAGHKVQRCLVHVHRNNLADLTRRPNTIPGRTLLTLSRRLLDISTRQETTQWMGLLVEFHATYATYLTQRTYAVDVPQWQRRPGKTWWYTHNRDRRVYQRLSTLAADGSLLLSLTLTRPERGLRTLSNPSTPVSVNWSTPIEA